VTPGPQEPGWSEGSHVLAVVRALRTARVVLLHPSVPLHGPPNHSRVWLHRLALN
jgi:hypothetical protein